MLRIGLAFIVFLLGFVGASADCATDFMALLRRHEAAGPSRISSVWIGGSTRVETLSEFVPPDSFHVVVKSSRGDEEFISIGRRMWQKKNDAWKTLDDAYVDAMLLRRREQGVFYSNQAQNIECHAEKNAEAGRYTGFTYRAQVGNRTMRLIMMVDAATQRPIELRGDADDNGLEARLSSTVTLTPSLKIAPPQLP